MIQPTRAATHPADGSEAGPGLPPARLRREQRIIAAMLRTYCRDHDGTVDGLCGDCDGLGAYAAQRLRAVHGCMTTIHDITNTRRIVDLGHKTCAGRGPAANP